LFVALRESQDTRRLLEGAVHATGVIVAMEPPENPSAEESRRPGLAPVFRFRDSSGKEHTVKTTLYLYPAAYRVGEEVPVVFQASAPDEARIYDFISLWGLPMILLILALLSWACLGYYAWQRFTGAELEAID
jgi:hypothetical protein